MQDDFVVDKVELEGWENSCKMSLAIAKSFRVMPKALMTRLCEYPSWHNFEI